VADMDRETGKFSGIIRRIFAAEQMIPARLRRREVLHEVGTLRKRKYRLYTACNGGRLPFLKSAIWDGH